MFRSLNLGALSLSAPLDEALRLTQVGGFEGLDVTFPDLFEIVQQTSIQEVKNRFDEAGIRSGGWILPVDFRNSESIYAEGLANLPRYAALAQELGSPWCATWIIPFSDELDEKANMAFHIRRLRPIAQILADHGCYFGLEFLGPWTLRVGHRYPFISSIAGALELGDQLQTGNTGLLLDSWHWYTSHATLADLTKLTSQQIIYVHVNDAPAGLTIDEQIDEQRLLPGTSGLIDVVGFLSTLDLIGYHGPVVAEPFNAEINTLAPQQRVRTAGQSLIKVWERVRMHSKPNLASSN